MLNRRCIKTRLVLSAVALGMLPSAAMGQAIPEKLRIVIEEISDEGNRCGITKESLNAAALSALRYNRIIVDESDYSSPYLYINVMPIQSSGNMCAMSYDFSIRTTDSLPDNSGKNYIGRFVFCETGGVGVGGPTYLAGMIGAKVRDSVDRCLAKITRTEFSFR